MDPVIQIAGALSVLAGFVLAQAGRVSPKSRAYLALNLAGSAVLAVDAAVHAQWGFLLLEGVWAVVSGLGLLRTRWPAAPTPQG